MEVREIELPGVGRKYAIRTSQGERLTVILHATGHREIYLFERGGEFPTAAVRLEDEEARQLGAILGGAWYQPVGEADLSTVLGSLVIDWYTISGGRLVDRSIAELQVRSETGASIIAVLREGEDALANPPPDAVLRESDTLVVIGSREQVDAFRRFAG